MKIPKIIDRYILIIYVLGIGFGGLFLLIQYGWWGLLIEGIIVAVVSPILAWYLMKKWGLIDWARDMAANKYIYGLELMKKVSPKKAAELEPLVEEWYKEQGGKQNGDNAARQEHKNDSKAR